MTTVVKDWVTEAGYRAIVTKMKKHGMEWFCGYVGIPKEHPLHNVGYNERHPCLEGIFKEDTPIGKRGIFPLLIAAVEGLDKVSTPDTVFNVHGSITYAGSGNHFTDQCTLDTGLWWFGFDGNHRFDSPRIQNAKYMQKECESLASQLAMLGAKK